VCGCPRSLFGSLPFFLLFFLRREARRLGFLSTEELFLPRLSAHSPPRSVKSIEPPLLDPLLPSCGNVLFFCLIVSTKTPVPPLLFFLFFLHFLLVQAFFLFQSDYPFLHGIPDPFSDRPCEFGELTLPLPLSPPPPMVGPIMV